MAWSEPVELMVLRDLASYGELARVGYEGELLDLAALSLTDHGMLAKHTDEDTVAAVEAVLSERHTWTSRTMAARLGLPTNRGTLLMLAGLLRARTGCAKAPPGWAAGDFAVRYIARDPLQGLAGVVVTRPAWTTAELAERLGLPRTPSTSTRIGAWLRAQGWASQKRKLPDAPRRNWRVGAVPRVYTLTNTAGKLT